MNPETSHQLYGGELSDYLLPRKIAERAYEDPETSTKNIGDIYDSQIKGKPAIDTTNIYSNKSAPTSFERDPTSVKIEQRLQSTLQKIAHELNINNEPQKNMNDTLGLKQQSTNDVEQANQNVLNALKELKDMKAI